ncbi:hypothetical protein [Maridesulfovibrio frigidus]|uniref:hypothetical protein n=1 Tax=Maridesulfovibrio frigidus TaxID=340956 RepID=UPI0004E1E1B0|nr:hypothetical protein [Maridesulfovibrio frigidus]
MKTSVLLTFILFATICIPSVAISDNIPEEYQQKMLQKKFESAVAVGEQFSKFKITHYKTGAEELQHRVDVLKQQYFLNYALFGIVLLLVAGGFILAWKQFDFDMKHREQHGPAGQAPASEVEIGPGGLKINSSVIGLIILLMSFAFFSIYITEVFPIKVISSKALTTNSTK